MMESNKLASLILTGALVLTLMGLDFYKDLDIPKP